MKRIAAHLLLLAGAAGCDAISGNSVPEAVQASFTALCPVAKAVDWDREDGTYEAAFEVEGFAHSARFSPDGSLLQYEEEIALQALPASAQDVLQAQYADFRKEAHRVQRTHATSYEVKLEQADKELIVLFGSPGELPGKVKEPAGEFEGSTAAAPTEPEARWELPAELREVSAIALLPSGLMACVQDEEGAIYLYDLAGNAVRRKIPFAAPGDFEGIAIDGNTAYVLRSDGTIFEAAGFRHGKPRVTAYTSNLAATQDAEGLALDKANNRLLIACKGYDKRLGNNKGIYAFSLADKQMQEKPAVTISLAQEQLPNTSKKRKDRYAVLQPSSLEVHPSTGALYLLDAANHRLMVLDLHGRIQQVAVLDKEQLRQAEGLAFGSGGEMYISSEGSKKGRGVIIKYPKGL